mmetsp:Transcript_8404/g.34114  ORF Transcript_8404/g.34114 Transcript_8404/m.34114 type:complete len:201 (-) Transcript_8404:1410-2012(-)
MLTSVSPRDCRRRVSKSPFARKVVKKCGTEHGYVADASLAIESGTGVGVRIVHGDSSCAMVLLPLVSFAPVSRASSTPTRPSGVPTSEPSSASPSSPLMAFSPATDLSPADPPWKYLLTSAPAALNAFRPRCLRSRLRRQLLPFAATRAPSPSPEAAACATAADVSERHASASRCASVPAALALVPALKCCDASGVSMEP